MNRILLLSLVVMLVVAAVMVDAGPRRRGRGRGRRPGRRPPPPPQRQPRPRPPLFKFAKVAGMLWNTCNDDTTKEGALLTICDAVLKFANGKPAAPDEGAGAEAEGQTGGEGETEGEGQGEDDTQNYEGQDPDGLGDNAVAEVDIPSAD